MKESKDNLNVIEALSFLNSIIKSAIEYFKVPTAILVDEVITKEEDTIFNNTVLGEFVLENFCSILSHFDIEKDEGEQKKIEGTNGETFTPLGIKRYLFLF